MSALPSSESSARSMLSCKLDEKEHRNNWVSCKICSRRAVQFDTVDFNKYCSQVDFYSFGFSGVRVDYNRCRFCRAIFTNFFDSWTPDDFSRLIYNDDYIKVDSEYVSVRPRFVANDMVQRWGNCRQARVLDYGSGTGAFADELRKLGYENVSAYDPFSSPERPTGQFDIITCFEVIEHTPSPVDTLKDICQYLKDDGCIIVSQTLQPDDIGRLRGNWWYVGPRNGHICTHTADSMAWLAQTSGLIFHLGSGPYAFSRSRRSAYALRALATMGRPHYFMPLLAPPGETPIKAMMRLVWNKREYGEDGPFRWTGTSKLTWTVGPMPDPSGTLRVMLSIFDRITPEHVEGIRGEFDGQKRVFHREGENLVADFEVRSGATAVTVRTLDPVTPRSLRGDDDDRRLALAILA